MSLLNELRKALDERTPVETKRSEFTKTRVKKPEEVAVKLAEALSSADADWRVLADSIRKNQACVGAFQRVYPAPKVTIMVYRSGTVTCQNGQVEELLKAAGLDEYILR